MKKYKSISKQLATGLIARSICNGKQNCASTHLMHAKYARHDLQQQEIHRSTKTPSTEAYVAVASR